MSSHSHTYHIRAETPLHELVVPILKRLRVFHVRKGKWKPADPSSSIYRRGTGHFIFPQVKSSSFWLNFQLTNRLWETVPRLEPGWLGWVCRTLGVAGLLVVLFFQPLQLLAFGFQVVLFR